jgi:hypothetical protein
MEAKTMAIFIDTCIFVALHDADDQNHQRSRELMKTAVSGKLGRMYTSDYVIDEAVTTALSRTGRHDIAVDLGTHIIESQRIMKLIVDPDTFVASWKKFKDLKGKKLSFTDCTNIALTEKCGIKQIMSFDCGFDGLVSRLF